MAEDHPRGEHLFRDHVDTVEATTDQALAEERRHDEPLYPEGAVEPWELDDVVRREAVTSAGAELPQTAPGTSDDVSPWSLDDVIERLTDGPWSLLGRIWPDLVKGVVPTSPWWSAPWGVVAIAAIVVLAVAGRMSWPACVGVVVVLLVMIWVGPNRRSQGTGGQASGLLGDAG